MADSADVALIKVYTAPTPFEAHFVRSLLEHRRIPAEVVNDGFSPYGMIACEVWVDELYTAVAEEVLREMRENKKDGALSITDPAPERGALSIACRHCSEENPQGFEVCWSCGAELA